MKFYRGDIEPDSDVIFVFGSNTEGRHGKGAAKIARQKFGAIYGEPIGLQGNSFAIVTKDLAKGLRSIPESRIIDQIKVLYQSAVCNPKKKYMIAYRTKADEVGLNGYSGLEMLKMFLNAGEIPENIYFSQEWKDILIDYILPFK